MAALTYFEIESFVSKFNFLTSRGYSADLRFTNLHGTINVEFKASLGCLNLNQEGNSMSNHPDILNLDTLMSQILLIFGPLINIIETKRS